MSHCIHNLKLLQLSEIHEPSQKIEIKDFPSFSGLLSLTWPVLSLETASSSFYQQSSVHGQTEKNDVTFHLVKRPEALKAGCMLWTLFFRDSAGHNRRILGNTAWRKNQSYISYFVSKGIIWEKKNDNLNW